jgi:hypothetical protein
MLTADRTLIFPIARRIAFGGRTQRRKETEMRGRLVVATAVAVVLAAGGAFAGEVKGPPGTSHNTNETGAPSHANSACAFSGLNDMDDEEGQNESQVQTARDSWLYYGLPHGAPGKLGLCKGGTN